MASKHASPKKRSKKFQGIPARGNIIPMQVPIVEEAREKQRDKQYVMVDKLRHGMGFFGIIQVLGLRLNVAKRLLETLFTDELQLAKVCEGLAALIQIKQRLDLSRQQLVGATDAEADTLVLALNVSDALEHTVTRIEYADAVRYVAHCQNSGEQLVKR